jgi:hypothetical protein
MPSDPELRRMWQGISVYDTIERAQNQARKHPRLGAYIAELHVTWGQGVHAERTGHRRGHHTLWGDARSLHSCVLSVVPVQ